jgi:cyanophycinase
VYDARQATITPATAAILGAANIRMQLLPAGSTFDPRTGTAHLP